MPRPQRGSGPTPSAYYVNSCSGPAFSVGGSRNVLTWLILGLAVWLSVGALTAQLFGAFVSGTRRSGERDEDDRDVSSSTRRALRGRLAAAAPPAPPAAPDTPPSWPSVAFSVARRRSVALTMGRIARWLVCRSDGLENP
jgi:hypothetical protein